MKGLYKAVTEAARLHDRHNRDHTAVRVNTIAYIYDMPQEDVLSMVTEAIEVLDARPDERGEMAGEVEREG